MDDGVFFLEEFANKGISFTFGNFFLMVYDTDGVSSSYSFFYAFNTFKEIAAFDNFTVKNCSFVVSCFAGKNTKMFAKWKVCDVVLCQYLLKLFRWSILHRHCIGLWTAIDNTVDAVGLKNAYQILHVNADIPVCVNNRFFFHRMNAVRFGVCF